MKIYVINLARRLDRWIHWKIEARKAKLPPYERWEAVDGEKLIITPEITHLFRHNDFHFKSSVMGCALSHYHIWKHIAKNELKETIIFEDDVLFLKPFEVPDLPKGWDLFYFGGVEIEGKPVVSEIPGMPLKGNIIIPQLPDRVLFCAYCYMLSLEGAKKLLKRVEERGIYRPIDGFMVDTFKLLNVYCYAAQSVYPTLDDTDVQKK